MNLVKNKRIGKVLLIVEGGKHEFNLIKKIFVDIFNFTQIEKRRGNIKYYVRKGDPHSVVAVVNTRTSNIASVNEIDYLEKIYEELNEQYDFDIANAAIYYLFDRDYESNKDKNLIKALIGVLRNSRENDNYMQGGMLILSYPSIEAYEISGFIDKAYKMEERVGVGLKKYISDNAKIISLNKINELSVLHAAREMEECLDKLNININLDDFATTNLAVFQHEEKIFEEKGKFHVLSLLSCVLLDLGMIIE